MKKLQTLTTSTAIALASVGGTAFAQEAQATSVPSNTAVNEPALVTKPQVKPLEKSEVPAPSSVKPALDAQKAVVKDDETKVDTAKADVQAKEATVASTEKEVDTATQAVKDAEATASQATPEKVAQVKDAQTKNVDAQKAVKDAEDTVANAQTMFKNATKADADRDQAIKSAETDVYTKNDAVKLAKEKLASATEHATNVENKLQSAQAELKSAQDKLANTGVDTVTIADLTQFKKDKAEGDSDFMTDSGATVIENSSTKISESDKKQNVELDNLTDEQKLAISKLYVKGLKQIREELNGLSETEVTDDALRVAKLKAQQYTERGLDPMTHGHIGAGVENLVRIGSKDQVSNLYELKEKVFNALMGSSFADAPSKWGHLSANLHFAKYIGIDIANINGEYWLVIAFSNKGNVIKDETDTASLEKAVETAKSNLAQAETASENAKQALTKASNDYASALSLKTEAEKVLANAMATPLQAQVAENNLRLAEIALENAKTREAKATEAVNNFSASLTDKKVALEKAQDALKEAKAVQKSASQALEDASAKLKAQEDKVNALNKQSAKLLEEKDALVKEAKKLAEELQAYLDAPAKLATAKDMKAKTEAKLETAKAELTNAQSTLENLLSAYRTEHAKLVDLQTEYEALVDLAEKAQENVVAKLPDGTVIAVPKVAPTAEALPEVNITELQKALATGKEVTLDAQGNVVVKEKSETYSAPAVKVVENEKMTYSRVEKSKTLPSTGENSSVAMLVLGAILGTFGIVTVRRKN